MDERFKPNKKYPHLFAILRYDGFQDDSCPIDQKVTVKKLVTSAEHAELEVKRLNELCHDQRTYYFYQIARLDEPNAALELIETVGVATNT